MVQNNKVLTVSYGTFSCTLEGFDDSFETMKAIAEYFRDLAADDRYFGSEPPQPDAEMLTRIAQRDVARRVEASQSDSGLLLRATEATAAAPTPAAIAPAPAPEPAQPATSITPPAASAAEPAPAADSIAAKLQRIRAVVSHSHDTPPAYAEDEDTSYLQPAEPQVDAISAAFEAGALSPADLDEPAPLPEQAEDSAAPAQEPVEDIEQDGVDLADLTSALAADDTYEDETTEDDIDLTALVSAPEVEEDETAQQDDTPAEVAESDVTDSDVLFSDLDDTPDAEETPEDEPNILSAETDADEAPSEALADIARDVISAEDEALLLDEIALVESELAAATPTEPMSGLDQDVSRLMDTAGARLDDPATSDQRETYSHLRTAVAATEAERAKGGDTATGPEDEYRGDLASVVSPRRPEVHVTSARPTAPAAAPLKLVAEQRVDASDDDADAPPVTPRRVTTVEEGAADEEGGFATFAQEQGAQSLPDLLEAAASYLSFIEGQEQFSRPQLMNKVRSLKQEAFNREESLRSFGQLLRDGKIEKAGGGRFAASTQIGFRPDDDERAAG